MDRYFAIQVGGLLKLMIFVGSQCVYNDASFQCVELGIIGLNVDTLQTALSKLYVDGLNADDFGWYVDALFVAGILSIECIEIESCIF